MSRDWEGTAAALAVLAAFALIAVLAFGSAIEVGQGRW